MGSGSPHDLHLQGNAYTGSWTESGTACSGALDSGSLVYTYQCGDKTIVIGLTKNG
ncbi:hypothetical protein [Mycobacterium sp.]|uniref:hypothetical protein n=1 Tax=Mycobacterium sp. TaxID=1785 RepID=UPI002D3832BE|nr:hypothetical protein [Mycobacterium sp.]HZA11070.1 hypothetical protein [Mycobacterium sp.]